MALQCFRALLDRFFVHFFIFYFFKFCLLFCMFFVNLTMNNEHVKFIKNDKSKTVFSLNDQLLMKDFKYILFIRNTWTFW